jgi:hypothetical protein
MELLKLMIPPWIRKTIKKRSRISSIAMNYEINSKPSKMAGGKYGNTISYNLYSTVIPMI